MDKELLCRGCGEAVELQWNFCVRCGTRTVKFELAIRQVTRCVADGRIGKMPDVVDAWTVEQALIGTVCPTPRALHERGAGVRDG